MGGSTLIITWRVSSSRAGVRILGCCVSDNEGGLRVQ